MTAPNQVLVPLRSLPSGGYSLCPFCDKVNRFPHDLTRGSIESTCQHYQRLTGHSELTNVIFANACFGSYVK